MILLDTNILGRLAMPGGSHHKSAFRAVHVLFARDEVLAIVPQNLYEFWAAATRKPGSPPSGQNGLGMSCERASAWLRFFQHRFKVLPDKEELLPRWHELVRTLAISGVKSHDARLAAAMQTHGITRLLTFNGDDFKKFGITVIDPASI